MQEYAVGVTAPPFHVYCRSTTAPAADTDFEAAGRRAARGADGKVYSAPGDMTYEEWEKEFVVSPKTQENPFTNFPEHDMIHRRKMAMCLRKPATHILTEKEIESIKKDAEALGIDPTILRFNRGIQTGFSDRYNDICICGDILPDLESSIARDRMSQRAVLAHEYYGHKANHPSRFPVGDWRDEFRASYCAAVYAPNLSAEDRMLLIIDAYDRAREAGCSVRLNEKAKEILYGV